MSALNWPSVIDLRRLAWFCSFLVLAMGQAGFGERVMFRTNPPEARVILEDAQGREVRDLGPANRDIDVTPGQLDSLADHTGDIHLAFRLGGYATLHKLVPKKDLEPKQHAAPGTVTYPRPSEPAWLLARLATAWWRQPLAAGLGLVLLGGGAVGGSALWRRARQRREDDDVLQRAAQRVGARHKHPAHLDDLVGIQVGGYRVERLLGTGGMATVYQARRVATGKLASQVAIKFLRRDLMDDPHFEGRFRHEFNMCQRLNHPAVIKVFSYGQHDGLWYIIMEYVAGGPLVIKPGGMPPDEVRRTLAPVFEAVAAAHEDGIVHRDLKPDNIMLQADGQSKVMDFGLARAADLTRMTESGDVVGTPAYIAPEQIRQRAVDGRCDQYALAIIAFEMLTGVLPFEAPTPMAMLAQHMSSTPRRLDTLRSDLPPGLSDVLFRMMAHDTCDRYDSLPEAWTALTTNGL